MRLSACACRAEHYRRAERSWWMKALPRRRLYRCYACDEVLFIPQGLVDERLADARDTVPGEPPQT